MRYLLQAVVVYLGIVTISFGHLTANLDSLRQVQIIFRHGARTIDFTYPTDPYFNESYWAPGYSQLTNLGKLQGYNLGLYLRERYDGFVGDTYKLRDVYVQSSDFARTMQTALSVMAGFYLPNELTTVNNETDYLVNNDVEIPLPWKSVPVHTIPEIHDNLLRQAAVKNCPRYRQLYSYLLTEDENVKGKFAESNDIRNYFYNATGLKEKDYRDSLLAYDTLMLQKYYNMTMPEWTDKLFETDLIKNWFLYSFDVMTYNDELKRLRSGPLVEKIVKNMVLNETLMGEENKSRGGRKRIHFFSGHDTTIVGVLDTLGIYNKKRPPFTSALMLELHQRENSSGTYLNDFYVEIYYRNETEREPYKLQLPGCDYKCPLPEFVTLMEPHIPIDWNQECALLAAPAPLSTGWIIIIVLVVWVTLFSILQFGMKTSCFNLIKRKQRQNSYSQLK